MKSNKLILGIIALLAALVFVACGEMPAQQGVAIQATVTLIPGYIQTPQAANAAAQATSAYGQAQMSELQVAATAVSMEMTSAAATEEHFARQTQAAYTDTAIQATAWKQSTMDAERQAATEQAAVMQTRIAVATAEQLANDRHSTDTAQAVEAANQAISTQAALLVLQANADAEVQRIQSKLAEERQTQLYRSWGYRIFWALLGTLFLVFVGLLVYSAYKFRMAIFARLGLVRWGRDGKPYMAIPLPGGGVSMLDMTKSAGPVVTVLPNGEALTPGMVEIAIQNLIAARSQAAELLLAANTTRPDARPNPLRAGLLKQASKAGSQPPAQTAIDDGDPVAVIDADWRRMDDWHGGPIPLGVGTAGLITAHNDMAPNLLVAGTTGSGKTRSLIRPFIAASLAAGRQVIILDRSGVDFLPFADHANVRLIALDQPEDVIGYLRSAYAEVQNRLRQLAEAGVSTWERWPRHGAQVVIVMDEFSNLADDMDGNDREELWRRARMVAAEGRKAGILLALALQDPTRRSIDLRIRRNCTMISFKVQDAAASQVVLGAAGAERIQPGHFLTVLDGLQHGVGFHPQDDDIRDFLQRRPVMELPDPDWLQIAGPEPTTQDKILTMSDEGMSMRQIEMELFGYAGGHAHRIVQEVLSATGATTGATDGVAAYDEK